jgi:DNA-binding NarL/FixJ family response regulator
MDSIRLLIADDHTFYREGIRAILNTVPGIEVIGEAASGEEVVAWTQEHQADVILMDIKMPGLNGIEATRQILRVDPQVKILIVTMFEEDEPVFAAMRAGARGYLLKDADQDELLRAIQAVYQGEAIFSPVIAQRMIQYFALLHQNSTVALPELTEREREILQLMARGRSNSAIASALSLSLKTVQNHISSIFSKLQVTDRASAIVRAHDAGLGTEPLF